MNGNWNPSFQRLFSSEQPGPSNVNFMPYPPSMMPMFGFPINSSCFALPFPFHQTSGNPLAEMGLGGTILASQGFTCYSPEADRFAAMLVQDLMKLRQRHNCEETPAKNEQTPSIAQADRSPSSCVVQEQNQTVCPSECEPAPQAIPSEVRPAETSAQPSASLEPKFRPPRRLDRYQVAMLEREFFLCGKDPESNRVPMVALKVGTSPSRVKCWFQSRLLKPAKPGGGLPRSMNQQFSSQLKPSQLVVLEREYKSNRYPSEEILREIADEIGLKISTVNSWYEVQRKHDGIKETMRRFSKQQAEPLRRSPRSSADKESFVALEKEFAKSMYLRRGACARLCSRLKMSKDAIYNWFSRRRQRELARKST